jgi:hypothetical protein
MIAYEEAHQVSPLRKKSEIVAGDCLGVARQKTRENKAF